MNKKYFTKYLPVEGGAKEIGDYYQIEIGSVGIIIDIVDRLRYKIKGLTGYFKDKVSNDIIIGQKKMKLFLCTRDIQVGDLVNVLINGEWKEEIVMSILDFQLNSFKVIGEISKDAIWVTEGMEFDDNELCFPYNSEDSWDIINKDEFNNIINSGEQLYVLIKCPCCKTFK